MIRKLLLTIATTFGIFTATEAQHFQSVINPTIPQSIEFAGSTYSFDRIDMYERLDRELTSMCYTHGNTLLTLKRANRYFPELLPLLRKNGIPDDIIYLCCIESNLNPKAYSPARAAGLWQFIASTGKSYGLEINDYVDERYNTEKATNAACRMLKKLYDEYGNWESAFAAYNGGPNKITRELEAQNESSALDLYLIEETSRYMFRAFAMKCILENPRAYGFNLQPEQFYAPIEYDVVEVSKPIANWADWANNHGISYAELREANLWIRAKELPNKLGKTYRVRIPKKKSLNRSTAANPIYRQEWFK